ncbi:MAG: TatD family hydrolase [Chromatiales bacterium]|nr:TatD family hydrolase [Gammaproteobacteria bacterium]MBW6476612.1 TatD family hydrolase [Chromatiales bacterium]
MLIDSHCHLDRLDLSPFDHDLGLALQAARDNDVDAFLCVAIDRSNIPDVLRIAEEHADVFASVGVHPNAEEDPANPVTAEELLSLAQHPKVIAIGETGLDYFRSEGDLDWQHQRFRQHIRAAKNSNKPLIIHCREAAADTMRILREEGADSVGGVMHCFVEDWATAEEAMSLGFMISFSGIVTFKNAQALQEVAKQLPGEYLLVETDSPYLAPVPYRGKSNQPMYVRNVAEFVAELRGESYQAVAEQSSANFRRLFRV